LNISTTTEDAEFALIPKANPNQNESVTQTGIFSMDKIIEKFITIAGAIS